MRTVVLCAVLLTVAVPSSGCSIVDADRIRCSRRLSTDSPRVRAIRASIDIARADVLAAGRWPNPRLTFDRESVAGVTENIMMVAQPLPITGRRGLEVQAASALVDASTSRADDEIRRARADLRLAFADLVAAQTRERELGAARARLRGLVEMLTKREAAGDAAGFDRLRAEREVLEIEADRATAATERARSQAAVASFFADGRRSPRLVAAEGVTARASLPPAEALIERAESTRGELLALRHEIEAARLAQRAADRRLIPEPEIVAGTKSSTAGGGDLGSVVTVHARSAAVRSRRPERALAEARATQAASRRGALPARHARRDCRAARGGRRTSRGRRTLSRRGG